MHTVNHAFIPLLPMVAQCDVPKCAAQSERRANGPRGRAAALWFLLAGAVITGCSHGDTASSDPAAAPSSQSWSDAQKKFAADVAVEVVPSDAGELRSLAVDAAAPPPRRAAALRELGKKRDLENMPTIIAALDDETMEVRGEAYNAAKQTVGLGVPIRAYDSSERRRPAVEAYRRLHKLAQENNVRYFIDLVPVLLVRMDDPDETVRRHAGEDIVRLMEEASYDYRADAPREERLRAVARVRQDWENRFPPGSENLEARRDPEKDQARKQKWIQNIKEKEAKGIPWTTDTRQRDAETEAAAAAAQAGR